MTVGIEEAYNLDTEANSPLTINDRMLLTDISENIRSTVTIERQDGFVTPSAAAILLMTRGGIQKATQTNVEEGRSKVTAEVTIGRLRDLLDGLNFAVVTDEV